MHSFIGLVILIPFLGFLVNGLFGRKIKAEGLIGTIGSACVGLPFLLSTLIFIEMLQISPDGRFHLVEYLPWITAGSLNVSFAFQVDQLSILMALIVTGVGFLIHVYSIGYMHGDPRSEERRVGKECRL